MTCFLPCFLKNQFTQEGHGGSTFCGTAALVLLGKLDEVLSINEWRKDLIRWCTHRQVGGMQGRPNKNEDTCYSYWIGGTLRLLSRQDDLLDRKALVTYIMNCQQPKMGGFSKLIGMYPDILHSFYSLAWLTLNNDSINDDGEDENGPTRLELNALNCTLGIRQSRAESLPGPKLP